MSTVRELLRQYGIAPSKGLGQNFVVDDNVLDGIIKVSGLDTETLALEVGPGLGVLTTRMLDRAGHVLAVELDRKMMAILNDTLGSNDKLTLVQGDILELAIDELLDQVDADAWSSYKVVANLPYYVTSAAIRRLLTARRRPEQLTLMIQREVAQRIVSKPGKMSLLAVSVQVFGEPEIALRVPRSAFFPQPKVDSAVLVVRSHPEPLVSFEEQERFFDVVRAGFAQKRKQLHNSLTHNLHLTRDEVMAALAQAGVESTRRPQTLTIEEWRLLAKALSALTNS